MEVLAAHRAGVRTVVLPRRNEKNVLEDVPSDVREVMTFHLADSVQDVLGWALEPTPTVASLAEAVGADAKQHGADLSVAEQRGHVEELEASQRSFLDRIAPTGAHEVITNQPALHGRRNPRIRLGTRRRQHSDADGRQQS